MEQNGSRSVQGLISFETDRVIVVFEMDRAIEDQVVGDTDSCILCVKVQIRVQGNAIQAVTAMIAGA